MRSAAALAAIAAVAAILVLELQALGAAALRLGDGDEVPSSVWVIENDNDFESNVLPDRHVWLLAVVSDNEPSAAFTASTLAPLAEAVTPHVKLGLVRLSDAKTVGYEYQVRKRTAPKLLLFSVRSRSAETLALKDAISDGGGDSEAEAVEVVERVSRWLMQAAEASECKRTDDGPQGKRKGKGKGEVLGLFEKATLALGGGEL